jgi:hypothetical protein
MPELLRGIEVIRFPDLRARLDGRALIKGLLEREQTSVIFGPPGCGKTFLALELALNVAAGWEVFGRRVAQGAVIYVAAEAGRSIANRVAAWRTVFCTSGEEPPFAAIMSPIDLCHPDGDLDALIAAIRDAAYGSVALVVIDTVSRVLAGGNENAPDDMGALVRSLDLLRDDLGCHVMAVHHTGKDLTRGSRGHSLLAGAVDTEIEVERVDGGSTATVRKQRDGATGGVIAFRLRQVELGHDLDGEPVTSCVVEALGAPPVKDDRKKLTGQNAVALGLLRDALRDGGNGAGRVEVEAWRERCERGGLVDDPANFRSAWSRALRDLRERGWVKIWEGHASIIDAGDQNELPM